MNSALHQFSEELNLSCRCATEHFLMNVSGFSLHITPSVFFAVSMELFDWGRYLGDGDVMGAPVSCFQHVGTSRVLLTVMMKLPVNSVQSILARRNEFTALIIRKKLLPLATESPAFVRFKHEVKGQTLQL